MKNIMLKTLSITLLSFAAMTVANAADTSKAETNMQIKACAKKNKETGLAMVIKALPLTVLANQTLMVNYNLSFLHHNFPSYR